MNEKAVDIYKGQIKVVTRKEFYVYCTCCDTWYCAHDGDGVNTVRKFTALLREEGWAKTPDGWICPYCAEMNHYLQMHKEVRPCDE